MISRQSLNFRLARTLVSTIRTRTLYDATNARLLSTQHTIIKADREPEKPIDHLQNLTINTLHKVGQSEDEIIAEEEWLDTERPGERTRQSRGRS